MSTICFSVFISGITEVKDELDKELVFINDGRRENGTYSAHPFLNELLAKDTTGETVRQSEKILPSGLNLYKKTKKTKKKTHQTAT